VESAVHLSHFGAMLIFALLVSVALSCCTRRSASGRAKFVLITFAKFIVVGLAIAWLLYPISR
jgi:bacteriorhodopsin